MQGSAILASSPTAIVEPGATIDTASGTNALNIESLSVTREGNWLSPGDSNGWATASGSISRNPNELVGGRDWKLPWGSTDNTLSGSGKVSAWANVYKNGASATPTKVNIFTGIATEWAGDLTTLDAIPIEDNFSPLRRTYRQDARIGKVNPLTTIFLAALSCGYYCGPNLFTGGSRAFGVAPLLGHLDAYMGSNPAAGPYKTSYSYSGSSPTYGFAPGAGFSGLRTGSVTYTTSWSPATDLNFPMGFSFRCNLNTGDAIDIGMDLQNPPGVSMVDQNLQIRPGSSSWFLDTGLDWQPVSIPTGVHDIAITWTWSNGNRTTTFWLDGVAKNTWTYQFPSVLNQSNTYVQLTATGSPTITGLSFGGEPDNNNMNTVNGHSRAPMILNAYSEDTSASILVDASPFISGDANTVIGEIASRIGANVGFDENGRLVVTTWRYAYSTSRAVNMTYDVNTTLGNLNWSGYRSEMPRNVKIRRRVPGISSWWPIVWVSEDKLLESGWESTEFITPEDNVDWVNVLTGMWNGWNNYRSCMEVQIDPSSTNKTGASRQLTYIQRMGSDNTWKVYFKNTSDAGVNQNYRFTSGPYAGGPSPVLRAERKISWIEQFTVGSNVGPVDGSEYVHDGDWCVSESEAQAMITQLNGQISSPYERVTNVAVWPEPGLQIGDHIQLNFAIDGRPQDVDYAEMLVTGISNELSNGSYVQVLSGRIIKIKKNIMWDTVDAQYASQYSSWNAVDSAKSSKTWDTVDASPLA